VKPEMTDWQKRILAEIEAVRGDPKADKRALKRMAHWLTADDDYYGEMKARERYREGRRGSRSPAFGKWRQDDEG